jgi:hypothetical protein
MISVLDRSLRFADLARLAEAEGWRRVEIPGLYPPLLPGEPELARFERGGEVLTASFNPAVGLRILDGAELAGAPVLDPRAIRHMLDSDDPATALCGILAAEASGLPMDRASLAVAVGRLSGSARGVALVAIGRIADRDAAAGGCDLLPASMRDRMLRAAMAAGEAASFRALALTAVRADPWSAASVAIGIVRLGLSDLAPLLGRRHPGLAGLPRRERELCEAIRQLALGTLSGGAATTGDTADARLWRAVDGRLGADPESLAVASLADPLPLPEPATLADLPAVRVGVVSHWLGHEHAAGLPNPIRRWLPPAAYRVAVAQLADPVPAQAIAEVLRSLGPDLRLPTAEEWEAALRGPDGRPRPWGRARRRDPGQTASPWGAEPGPRGVGEWAIGRDGLVVCGADPDGLVALHRQPIAGEACHIRPAATG